MVVMVVMGRRLGVAERVAQPDAQCVVPVFCASFGVPWSPSRHRRRKDDPPFAVVKWRISIGDCDRL